eukprot:TRINITY_DN32694_c0_g1_i1.p1 TRINITY_DN32694_c0_g1~~TRINITY_DN32694_c0_g1_i1.p1  ORF type:complete len:599 (+),score=151.21 TRINITY_DN32694_c0_g1_i1:143-1939(+)
MRREKSAPRSTTSLSRQESDRSDRQVYRKMSLDLREERTKDEAARRAMEKRIEDLQDQLAQEQEVRQAIESANADAVVGVHQTMPSGEAAKRRASSLKKRSRGRSLLRKRRASVDDQSPPGQPPEGTQFRPLESAGVVNAASVVSQPVPAEAVSVAALAAEVDRLRDDLEGAEINYHKERLGRQRLEVEIEKLRSVPPPPQSSSAPLPPASCAKECARLRDALCVVEEEKDALRQQLAAAERALLSNPDGPERRKVSLTLVPSPARQASSLTVTQQTPPAAVLAAPHTTPRSDELQSWEHAARQAEGDARQLVHWLSVVEERKRAAEQQVAALTAELEAAKAEVVQQVAVTKGFCEEELRRCDTVHQRQCEQLTKQLEACRQQRDQQIDRAGAAEEELTALRRESEGFDGTAQRWKAAAEESFLELRCLQEENEALSHDVRRLRQVQEEVEERVSRDQHSQRLMSGEVNDLRDALSAAQRVEHNLRERLRSATVDYDALEADIARKSTEHRHASTALRGVLDSVALLHNSLLSTSDGNVHVTHVLDELRQLLRHAQTARAPIPPPPAAGALPAKAHVSPQRSRTASSVLPSPIHTHAP